MIDNMSQPGFLRAPLVGVGLLQGHQVSCHEDLQLDHLRYLLSQERRRNWEVA